MSLATSRYLTFQAFGCRVQPLLRCVTGPGFHQGAHAPGQAASNAPAKFGRAHGFAFGESQRRQQGQLAGFLPCLLLDGFFGKDSVDQAGWRQCFRRNQLAAVNQIARHSISNHEPQQLVGEVWVGNTKKYLRHAYENPPRRGIPIIARGHNRLAGSDGMALDRRCQRDRAREHLQHQVAKREKHRAHAIDGLGQRPEKIEAIRKKPVASTEHDSLRRSFGL